MQWKCIYPVSCLKLKMHLQEIQEQITETRCLWNQNKTHTYTLMKPITDIIKNISHWSFKVSQRKMCLIQAVISLMSWQTLETSLSQFIGDKRNLWSENVIWIWTQLSCQIYFLVNENINKLIPPDAPERTSLSTYPSEVCVKAVMYPMALYQTASAGSNRRPVTGKKN